MYPDTETLAQMVVDLVVASEWTSFTIMYENPEWLPRTAKLLELYDTKGFTVTVRRLDLRLATKDYRSILRRIKQSSDTCIVVECSIESLEQVLQQAQQIGLLIDKYQFIITNLDAHTINLEPFQYGDAGITLVQMVDTNSEILLDYAEYLKKSSSAEKSGEAGEGGEGGDGEGGEGGGEGEGSEQPEEGGGGEETKEGEGGEEGEEGGKGEGDGHEGEEEEKAGEAGEDGGEGGESEKGEEGGEGEKGEEGEGEGEGDGEDGEEASEAPIEEAGRIHKIRLFI